MVIEMTRLVIAEPWWPNRGGRNHYSMIPNRLEVQKLQCNKDCSVNQKTAIGDQFDYPFLQRATHTKPAGLSVIGRAIKRCRKLVARMFDSGNES